MRKHIFLFLGFLLLLGAYFPATCQANLVTNPGFESGNFSGWVQSGNLGDTGVGTAVPHSGTYAAFLGPVGSNGSLTQFLATTPGQWYTVSFWLRNGQPGNNSNSTNTFNLFWDGIFIFNLNNAPLSDYIQYSFVEQATSSSTPLTLGFRNDLNYFYLDDIDVSPVPIPGAVWLFGSGLAGLVGVGRKRLKK